MTYEQALNCEQKWTAEQAFNDLERYLLRDERPAYKAVALGMLSLEKQIPKKPTKICEEYTNGRWVEEWECSSCGNTYIDDSFCPCCGQALDWSGTK